MNYRPQEIAEFVRAALEFSIFDAPTGTVSSGSYCVKGAELQSLFIDKAMPVGDMGTMKIDVDVVFTKQ